MLALLGILVVLGAVFGGFILEKGNPWVLMQPAELLIIGGAAVGIVIVANSPAVIRKMLRGVAWVFRPRAPDSRSYLKHLRMLYEIFVYAQRSGGVMQLEADVEDPDRSAIFSNHPEFLRDHGTREFVCDSLRMLVIGATSPHELNELMDLDIEVQRRARQEPVSALTSVAEALPGLGIVAAVLGVVITMEAIGGSPETIGQKVAAALVGTFLGILLCYGVVGPLASRLEHLSEAEAQFQQAPRIAIVAFARGCSPILAIEYARRSIPPEVRPSFLEMEVTIKRDAKIPPLPKPESSREAHDVAVAGA
jgi:chemotaxis protein MotA